MTVAVCTRDNPRDVDRCLSALSEIRSQQLDVLVVDNAPSSEATRKLVSERHPTVLYECEPTPGLDYARNRAIEVAEGEIIAFIDDDVVVRPGWLEPLIAGFETPGVVAVTGLVVPLEQETDAQVYFERYGGFGCGMEARTIPSSEENTSSPDPRWALECGTGANMAFRRSIFEEIGPFDPALDVGTPTNGGGDIEMFYRVLKAGHALRYEPEALVAHRHRRDWDQLCAQIRGWGSGLVAFLVRSARAYPEERWALASLGAGWLAQQLRRFVVSLFRPPGFPRRLILFELYGAAQGFRRYEQSLRKSRSVASR